MDSRGNVAPLCWTQPRFRQRGVVNKHIELERPSKHPLLGDIYSWHIEAAAVFLPASTKGSCPVARRGRYAKRLNSAGAHSLWVEVRAPRHSPAWARVGHGHDDRAARPFCHPRRRSIQAPHRRPTDASGADRRGVMRDRARPPGAAASDMAGVLPVAAGFARATVQLALGLCPCDVVAFQLAPVTGGRREPLQPSIEKGAHVINVGGAGRARATRSS
jgi:hypothetical protein